LHITIVAIIVIYSVPEVVRIISPESLNPDSKASITKVHYKIDNDYLEITKPDFLGNSYVMVKEEISNNQYRVRKLNASNVIIKEDSREGFAFVGKKTCSSTKNRKLFTLNKCYGEKIIINKLSTT